MSAGRSRSLTDNDGNEHGRDNFICQNRQSGSTGAHHADETFTIENDVPLGGFFSM
jgi:hypothetical protein